MKRSGAWLAVRALEAIGVTHTFGIPGVHTTELYDELGQSASITPVLVTHEGGGAFMADAMSRLGGIGTLAIVPAAGVTHAMSGIGEAFLDGIPMLVISGGIRRDTGRAYQLHDIDQLALVRAVTKAAWRVTRHEDIAPTIYEAYRQAITGEPGPVFIEIPADLLMLRGEVASVPPYEPPAPPQAPDPQAIDAAIRLLSQAKRPGIYLGWGATHAQAAAIRLAECLEAPVATTLQGLSAFPGSHPLHVGMGFGAAAVPAARKAFAGCDALVAVGVRFSELATGSYSMPVPEQLVHIDINPAVFDRNYKTAIALHADAEAALTALVTGLVGRELATESRDLRGLIQREKARERARWSQSRADKVSPGRFFTALRERLGDQAILVADDGHHTFLCAELFEVRGPRRFLSPSDFNCMGYCVPAAIGAKLASPQSPVVAIVGDGAFLMTGMEILTASRLGLGIPFFVFADGELAQIAQLQQLPLNRKTCSQLGPLKAEGVAMASGAAFLSIGSDAELGARLDEALTLAQSGRPVVVEVRIDYAKRTRFTRGVVQATLSRMPFGEKLRMVGRAIGRRLGG